MRSKLILHFVLILLLPFTLLADTSEQTDWSGGSGTYGPVTDWGSDFYSDSGVRLYTSPSDLSLGRSMLTTPVEYLVADDFIGPYAVSAADLNTDGFMDVVCVSVTPSRITWWENTDGSGTIWTEHTIDESYQKPNSVTCADINGDGHVDILTTTSYQQDVTWWENSDTAPGIIWTEHTIDGNLTSASSVCPSDLNGDGSLDVIAAAFSGYTTTWWENVDGSGTDWIKRSIDGTVQGVTSLRSEDINGDGYMDVAGGSHSYDAVFWWENIDGSGTSWTRHMVEDYFQYPISICCADVNGNGHMDVVGAAFGDNRIVWWENVLGTGLVWSWNYVANGLNYPYSVCASDLDGNGTTDLIAAVRNSDQILWWENIDGSGTNWGAHTVTSDLGQAIYALSADLNGDGCDDILGAGDATVDDVVAWWDLTDPDFYSEGILESSILDVEVDPIWQFITWTGTEPDGTDLAFQVRASDNPGTMGEWSDTLTAPCSLSVIIPDRSRYFQYRVILTTDDISTSPYLHDLAVEWQSASRIGESSSEPVPLHIFSNPSPGYALLEFSLTYQSLVELTVFDISGRAVHLTRGEFIPGRHEILIDDLINGVYLVQLRYGGLTETLHFVVVK